MPPTLRALRSCRGSARGRSKIGFGFDAKAGAAALAFAKFRPYSCPSILIIARMSMVPGRLGFAFVFALVALCLTGRAAHAQESPVPYWTSGWQTGFGGGLIAGQRYGGIAGFDGSDSGNGSGSNFSARYNFSNGWFVGSEHGGLGLSMNGFSQDGAWSNARPLSYEGVQFGYNFTSAPVTVYAGFDSLKYNTGIGSSLAGFDSMSSTVPGYSAHAGIEFRPTSNLSLSLGVGYAQQPGGIESGINSLSLPGASAFAFGRR
jgi:opacity protein-like surface antigen